MSVGNAVCLDARGGGEQTLYHRDDQQQDGQDDLGHLVVLVHVLGADQQRGGGGEQDDDDRHEDVEGVVAVLTDDGVDELARYQNEDRGADADHAGADDHRDTRDAVAQGVEQYPRGDDRADHA